MQCQDEDESDNSLPRTWPLQNSTHGPFWPVSQPPTTTHCTPTTHCPPTELHSFKDQKVQTAAANVSMLGVQTEKLGGWDGMV